ncbi:endonuclease/exonuclease/phosphatase family protein [Nocardioides sp. SYSU DS0651]|uniref:endonuclease/exonuclease/phosphatase family protein n=1 Tax=Nocardioides sp. SYSU DS0651 TaxID=3415955 RepID=UPI003F4B659B
MPLLTDTGVRLRRPHALLALVAALACAATVLAAPPAHAAKPGKARPVWVTHNLLRANGTVDLRLEWPRAARAGSYEIDYAPASGGIQPDEVQRSRSKRVKKVRGTSRSVQAVMMTGLKQGTTYCFQVRGRNGSGYGYRSGLHCKVTTRSSRPKPAEGTSFPLVVGTFNTCSSACNGELTNWASGRAAGVRKRILEMGVGGRPADVVALQEASLATDSFQSGGLAGFQRACQTHADSDNQSVFVRTDSYDIVPGTSGGTDFAGLTGNKAQGACWVQVRHRETQQRVVVVSLHLTPGSSSDVDARRAKQMTEVLDLMEQDGFGADTPTVFAGDFNSHRNRATDAPLKALYAHGRHDDAYDMAARRLSRPNRNSSCDVSTVPQTSDRWGDHVDRVFAPRGAHVATWEVDYRTNSTNTRYVTPIISDHNPVLVSLELPRLVQ